MTWTIVGLVLGGIGLGGAAVMGHAFRVSRRRQKLLTQVGETRSAEATLRQEGEEIERTGTAITRRLQGPARAHVDAAVGESRAQLAELRKAVGPLPRQVADFERVEVDDVERQVAVTGHLVEQGRAAVERARQEIDAADQRIGALPGRKAAVTDAVHAGATLADDLYGEGWLVQHHRDVLQSVAVELRAVDVLAEPLDLVGLESALAAHQDVVETTTAAVAGHPERHRALGERLSGLEAALAGQREGHAWLSEETEAWQLAHHRDSWSDIADAAEGADSRLELIAGIVDGLRADGGPLSMDRQAHDEAEAGLGTAEGHVDALTLALDGARERSLALADARVHAEERLDAARAAVEALGVYVTANARDLEEGFAPKVQAGAARLEVTAALLDLDPANWLGASTEAVALAAQLVDERAAAEAEVARMDELRSRATRAIASARSAIGRLDDYTDGLLAEVFGGSRRRNVDSLQSRLARLGTHDPETAIRSAPQLEREAEDLLEEYQRDDAAADDL